MKYLITFTATVSSFSAFVLGKVAKKCGVVGRILNFHVQGITQCFAEGYSK